MTWPMMTTTRTAWAAILKAALRQPGAVRKAAIQWRSHLASQLGPEQREGSPGSLGIGGANDATKDNILEPIIGSMGTERMK